MMRCLRCSSPLIQDSCRECGWTVESIEGFDIFAPEYAQGGGGFESAYFAKLAKLESGNFWFQARSDLILWALKKYGPEFKSFMEIGCGTGFVLSGVRREYPAAELLGSEIFIEGLRYASQRLPNVRLVQMDARENPFVSEFDVIGAFDVLEHIEEDETVLRQMNAALRPNGTLLVTVPQHPWLWSSLDEYSHHHRRYTYSEISRKISAAGFRVVRATSFVSFLLPVMVASRLLRRNKPVQEIDVGEELELPSLLNSIFGWILRAEGVFIKAGLDLPLGGSRLVVARKIDSDAGRSRPSS